MGGSASSKGDAAAEDGAGSVQDITKCPLCSKSLNDPVVLPCFHSFCRQCVAGVKSTKSAPPNSCSSGDRVECPACGKICHRSLLKDNAFIAKLLELQRDDGVGRGSSGSPDASLQCDVCLRSSPPLKIPATKMCFDCGEAYCGACSEFHRKMSLTLDHRLRDVVDRSSSELGMLEDFKILRWRRRAESCSAHRGKPTELYCVECSAEICLLCHVESHNKHGCCSVEAMTKDYRSKIDVDVAGVRTAAEKFRSVVEKLDADLATFDRQIDDAKQAANVEADVLKKLIDDQMEKLTEQLKAEQDRRRRDVENVRKLVQTSIRAMESFVTYSEAVKLVGSVADLKEASGGLRARAEELVAVDAGQIVDSLSVVKGIEFVPSGLIQRAAENVVGNILVEEEEPAVRERYGGEGRSRGLDTRSAILDVD